MKIDVQQKLLITILKSWCFQTPVSAEILPAVLDSEISEQISLMAGIYYYYHDRLPKEQDEKYRNAFQSQSLLDLRYEVAFREIKELFTRNHIPFCPLKGADLAWRVYPSGALRSKCDLDILVPRESCAKALALLQENKWDMPYQLQKHHHFPPMNKNNIVVELHDQLPHIKESVLDVIWDEMIPGDGTLRRLPLEWNLLMLFHHCRCHGWQGGIKLLQDYGFLLQKEGKPDWEKLEACAKLAGVASPRVLFEAFPDFFSAILTVEEKVLEPQHELLRKLILTKAPLAGRRAEMVMHQKNRFGVQWWRSRLQGMAPATIRLETGNPAGNYGKLFLGYWKIGIKKIKQAVRYGFVSPDGKLKIYLQEKEDLEIWLGTKTHK